MDSENKKTISPSGEFPAVSTQQWEDKIREDLCGADYDKKLIWETQDHYRIRPYYRAEDLEGIDHPIVLVVVNVPELFVLVKLRIEEYSFSRTPSVNFSVTCLFIPAWNTVNKSARKLMSSKLKGYPI